MPPKESRRQQPIAAKRRIRLNSEGMPMRRPCVFLARLCLALSFLLVTPEYSGIDTGNIVPHQMSELEAWGLKFYPAFSRGAERDNTPLLAAYLTARYRVEPLLAERLAGWAGEYEHGRMILAIMAVESTFRPELVGVGGRGLGQINPIHLREDVIRGARLAGRPTLLDKCGVRHEADLYEPEMNFCATRILYGVFLERRGSVEKALHDYVGSRGEAGQVYARKVMRAHAEIAGMME
jgi:hypothetical protein